MASSSRTSETLGFAPDARLLIINIDDAGFCLTANHSAIQTLDNGTASSCTVMMPPAWSIHACSLLVSKPKLSHGIHLTAMSEHTMFRWRPLTSREKIPTLVDREGFFLLETDRNSLLDCAAVNELEIEWRAQIENAYARGLQPVHLDSHCNIHDAREDILHMTVRLAREYGLALRINQGQYIEELNNAGLRVIDHPAVDSYRIPTHHKFERYKKMLRELPVGITEWAVHCARGTGELRTIDPSWRVRAADFRFFNSEECIQLIQSEGIHLIGYDALQPYWKH